MASKVNELVNLWHFSDFQLKKGNKVDPMSKVPPLSREQQGKMYPEEHNQTEIIKLCVLRRNVFQWKSHFANLHRTVLDQSAVMKQGKRPLIPSS